MRHIQPKKVRELSIEEMMEMRRQGVTLRELGERLGISKQRVHQILGYTRDIKPRKQTPEERRVARIERSKNKFLSNIKIASDDDCWNWQGCINPITGYGEINFIGKRFHAHKLAYILHYGEIKAGLHILHSCDNPACCNPRHLRAGTMQENIDDRGNRNRTRGITGSRDYYTQRRKYIFESCQNTDDVKRVAAEFGVSTQDIYTIWRRMINRGTPHPWDDLYYSNKQASKDMEEYR